MIGDDLVNCFLQALSSTVVTRLELWFTTWTILCNRSHSRTSQKLSSVVCIKFINFSYANICIAKQSKKSDRTQFCAINRQQERWIQIMGSINTWDCQVQGWSYTPPLHWIYDMGGAHYYSLIFIRSYSYIRYKILLSPNYVQ